jgi:hypothetical protein
MAAFAVCFGVALVGGALLIWAPAAGWLGHAMLLAGVVGAVLSLVRWFRRQAIRSVDAYSHRSDLSSRRHLRGK